MPILFIGSILGFASVALGAFGAHGLGDRLTPESKDWWETATLYALVHSALLTGLGLARRSGVSGLEMPGLVFCVGILIFAGTLYAMSLGAPRWFGAITPIGGLALLVGWGWLAVIGLSSTTK